MKKKGKALLAVIMCAAMAFAMTACGGSQKSPSTEALYSNDSNVMYSMEAPAETPAETPAPEAMTAPSREFDGEMKMAADTAMADGTATDSIKNEVEFNTEEYKTIEENRLMKVSMSPLSTFSIDVDTASYSNMRRYIENGQKPPADAVRIEELINYFTYDLSAPDGNVPFSVTT